MNTRVITAIVGLIVLAMVLLMFNTSVFNLIIAAVTLIAVCEVYHAMGMGKKEWPLLAVWVPFVLAIMMPAAWPLVLPMAYLLVAFI